MLKDQPWVPIPQQVEALEGEIALSDMSGGLILHLASRPPGLYPIAGRLRSALIDRGLRAEISAAPPPEGAFTVTLAVDAEVGLPPQGYRLTIDRNGIAITGADAAGLFYGVGTLIQLLGLPALPCLRVEDWPDVPQRGVMLDVSRDKVPTLATLYGLVDLLARWKVNQLQLYMEHTFAYAGHKVVWEDASPLTGEDILALDAYCRARFIELVPNQNSFGHMHRWLQHDAYRPLAECPDGSDLWPGYSGAPFSLCPIDPGSLALLADLYDQLLPHFRSDLFNVGLDETFDLGHGRSAEACERHGTERVYLDFLKEVHALVAARGHTMQFWGDIILHAPELIPELPQDAIALEWGYEADHPFAEHCEHFAEAGMRFYVCPGTSSWNAIAGRTENALRNLQNAATHGAAAGAEGLLNTDWGDNGHLQPLPVSYLGFMAGAAVSWNVATDLFALDLPGLLDRHVFQDAAGVMGALFYDLGNVYCLPGVRPSNASALFHLLVFPERPLASEGDGVTREGLAATLRELDRLGGMLPAAQMRCSDADLIRREARWVADTLHLAARLGLARLEGDLDPATRAALAYDLRPLIARHRALWLARNRPGGLDDSVARLERLLAWLEA
jgi:hypothetical protein